MTIYEVLERIVSGDRFRDDERETAVKLIRQMRDLNVLGTTARFLDPATHECRQGGEYWPYSGSCGICGTAMPVLPHTCSPVTRWAGSRWSVNGGHYTQCRICGKEI